MPNKYWAEEIASIRKSLSIAFGHSVGSAMMKKWELTEDRHELHALQHETSDGKPLGYAMLIAKDRAAVDRLIAANRNMKSDEMELAATSFSPARRGSTAISTTRWQLLRARMTERLFPTNC